jgi:hypothetical protein
MHRRCSPENLPEIEFSEYCSTGSFTCRPRKLSSPIFCQDLHPDPGSQDRLFESDFDRMLKQLPQQKEDQP